MNKDEDTDKDRNIDKDIVRNTDKPQVSGAAKGSNVFEDASSEGQ